jgi:hypothetical protein
VQGFRFRVSGSRSKGLVQGFRFRVSGSRSKGLVQGFRFRVLGSGDPKRRKERGTGKDRCRDGYRMKGRER